MAKSEVYSATMLMDLSTKELIQVINRQAEKYNKQITRAKKAGIYEDFKKISPDIKRPRKIKNTDVNIKRKDTPRQRELLIRKYLKTEKQFRGGVTKTRLREIESRKAEYEKKFFAGEDIPYDLYNEIEDIQESANTNSAMYYEMLKIGVETGYIEDFSESSRIKVNLSSDKTRRDKQLQQIMNKIRRHAKNIDTVSPAMKKKLEEDGSYSVDSLYKWAQETADAKVRQLLKQR